MRTLLFCTLLAAVATTAHAATLTTNGLGQVTGASGVTSEGESYTIVMADGTCAALFSGCNDDADFLPLDASNRLAAQRALVDFLEAVWAQGHGPGDIVGCIGSISQCSVYAPWEIVEPVTNPVFASTVAGLLTVSGLAQGGTQGISSIQDFAAAETVAWAYVTVSVPEPGSLLLVSAGLAALSLRRRR